MKRIKYPMREKKKAISRQRLIEAAQELFATKGYENTTLEEVADSAGLHVQTLYRHFANKQELAAAGLANWIRDFREAIQSPDRKDTTFDFWRNWLKTTFDELSKDDLDGIRRHAEMLQSHAMVGSSWLLHREYQDLLAESLAKDFDLPSRGIHYPRLVAGMLTAGNIHVMQRYVEYDTDIVSEAIEVVDTVETNYQHLIVRPQRRKEEAA